MAIIYFPACKVTAKHPEISQRMLAYLQSRFEGLQIAGCCKGKGSLTDITPEDTVIYVCTMCAMFVKDGSAAQKVVSIWEIIDADESFAFPSHAGRSLTIQDCWRLPDETELHDTVRSLLGKMGCEVTELVKNRASSDYCGTFLYNPNVTKFARLSTRIAEHQDQFFQPHTDDELAEKMQAHAELFTTNEVACYCSACLDGFADGDLAAWHLFQLIFG